MTTAGNHQDHRHAVDDGRHERRPSVVKLGGRVQRDPGLGDLLATWWHAHPQALCVVHGGGDEVSALQNAMGIKPTFVDGRRVTAPEDIDLVRMALSGAANKRLVHLAVKAGLPAVGVSGEDAALLLATVRDGGVLGAVGQVHHVNAKLIHALWSAGYLPIVSPLASPALNVNGDEAAAALAAALNAEELVLISDVPAVQLHGAAISTIDDAQAREGLLSGEISGGMVVKVQAALAALAHGVRRVRIGGVGLLNGTESGTTVHHEHEGVTL